MIAYFSECDFELPALDKPVDDPEWVAGGIGAKQGLWIEASMGIAQQHPADRHDRHTAVIPDSGGGMDLHEALTLTIPTRHRDAPPWCGRVWGDTRSAEEAQLHPTKTVSRSGARPHALRGGVQGRSGAVGETSPRHAKVRGSEAAGGVSFALTGLAGNNAHGAGFLAAALDRNLTPKMISCTSGQIWWVYLFLGALGRENGDSLGAELDRIIREAEPYPSRDLNLFHLMVTGIPDVMRLAFGEAALDVGRNAMRAGGRIARDCLLAWFRAYLGAIGPAAKSAAPFLLGEFTRIPPARSMICLFSQDFYEKIAKRFNKSKIAISFNTFDPKAGTEVVHMNDEALRLLRREAGSPSEHRTRTRYDTITESDVRDALWLYQYGFERARRFDGCYFRHALLSEVTASPLVFVSRPINWRWLGELPQSLMDLLDMQTEVSMNGSYQGERDKIELMNNLVRSGHLSDGKSFHEIELVEIECMTQRGYFDYIFEDRAVFDAARACAFQKFARLDQDGAMAGEPHEGRECADAWPPSA